MRGEDNFTSKREQTAHVNNMIMTSLDMIIIFVRTSGGATTLLWIQERIILNVVLSEKMLPIPYIPLQCCCLSRQFNRMEIKATRHAE